MDISTFYFTAAGAAATLMGLLFIALQFNLERRAGETRWVPVARATFTVFLMLFTLSILALIPFSDLYEASKQIHIIIPTLAIFFQLSTWWQYRNQLDVKNWKHLLWLIGIPVVLYGLMIVVVLTLPSGSKNRLDIEVPGAVLMTMLFSASLRNSWQLVLQAGLGGGAKS